MGFLQGKFAEETEAFRAPWWAGLVEDTLPSSWRRRMKRSPLYVDLRLVPRKMVLNLEMWIDWHLMWCWCSTSSSTIWVGSRTKTGLEPKTLEGSG